MSDIAIRVEDISKRYRLGQSVRYDTLRESVLNIIAAPLRRLRSAAANPVYKSRQDSEYIWALKDVSFDVKQGEVVGIIGRNGAGKSTLLKILSRITAPTEGYAEVRGQVRSLLEVGTGFHPELTGRENIYFSGAILGMKKTEIDRKFAEIVDFSGVERFIDTPVKRYSDGMRVRLGFAVAAHLEPAVLLVDEVLAVGDAEFQKKCLGKMGDVAQAGRTVLFISHNMGAVAGLCSRAILLDSGRLALDDQPQLVIQSYLRDSASRGTDVDLRAWQDRKGSGKARFTRVRVLNENKEVVDTIPLGQPLVVEASFEVTERLRSPIFSVAIRNNLGEVLLQAHSRESAGEVPQAERGGKFTCVFHHIPLMPGDYNLTLWLGIPKSECLDEIHNAASFTVQPADVYGTGRPPDRRGGVCFTPHSWDFDYA